MADDVSAASINSMPEIAADRPTGLVSERRAQERTRILRNNAADGVTANQTLRCPLIKCCRATETPRHDSQPGRYAIEPRAGLRSLQVCQGLATVKTSRNLRTLTNLGATGRLDSPSTVGAPVLDFSGRAGELGVLGALASSEIVRR